MINTVTAAQVTGSNKPRYVVQPEAGFRNVFDTVAKNHHREFQ